MAIAPASRYLSLFFKNSNQYKLHISLFPFRQVDHIDQLLNRSCELSFFNQSSIVFGRLVRCLNSTKKFRAKTGRIRQGIENVNVDVITISPDNIWTLLV